MSDIALNMQSVTAGYVPNLPILHDVSIQLVRGTVTVIIGPNGAGKSTLGYVLSGREGYEITSGEVLFNGINIAELEPEERAQLAGRAIVVRRLQALPLVP